MLRTTLMPASMALVGVAIVVRTLVGGGGPIATGLVIGALFVAAGVLRLWVEHR